jgi:hypothetical protein
MHLHVLASAWRGWWEKTAKLDRCGRNVVWGTTCRAGVTGERSVIRMDAATRQAQARAKHEHPVQRSMWQVRAGMPRLAWLLSRAAVVTHDTALRAQCGLSCVSTTGIISGLTL